MKKFVLAAAAALAIVVTAAPSFANDQQIPAASYSSGAKAANGFQTPVEVGR